MITVLQKLSLVAYRGITDLTLDGLTPVSLIVGANNAGKSSMLEAAGIVLRPPDPAQWVSAVRRRDADMDLVDGIWSMFPGSEALHLDDDPQGSSRIIIDATLSGAARHMEAASAATQTSGSDEGAALAIRVDVSINGEPPVELFFPLSKGVRHQVATYRVFTVTPASHYSTSTFVEPEPSPHRTPKISRKIA